jgi:hypothetical protein
MIFELPNFVSKEELDFINTRINSYTDTYGMEMKQNSYRDGETLVISNNERFLELDKFLHNIFASSKLLGFINRRYRPALSTGDSGYEFHRYSPGNICNVHGDGETPTIINLIQGEQSLIRFLSVVLHLNTPANGGELIFPELNRTIKTEAGKIVLFPPYNFVQHYTNPSTDSRDVIVTWFVYDKLRAVVI